MSARIDPTKKDRYWAAIMSEHTAGRRPSLYAVCRIVEDNPKHGWCMFRMLVHYGYLCQDARGYYDVSDPVERLPDDVRWTPVEPRDGVYRPRYPSTRKSKAKKPAPAFDAEPPIVAKKSGNITASWRRVVDGVATDAHGRPLRREFRYHLIACVRCGEMTVDGERHYATVGWQIDPGRCICPRCKE